MQKHSQIKIRIADLLPHEKINSDELNAYIRPMLRTGVLRRPIVVYHIGEKYIILDGHHRVEALRAMGYQYIMASTVDYFSPDIRARSWKKRDQEWDKSEIVSRALAGELMEPKSTKHQVRVKGNWVRFRHTAKLMPVINQPLETLK